MRERATAERIRRFLEELGRAARGPGTVYLTGGATAVLLGWRDSTLDIDVKLDPEPPGAFEAIARLKDALDVSVELAAPDDFVPAPPGWRERSPLVGTFGRIEVRHFDFYAQALAKIERGHAQDAADVREMLARGLVRPAELRRAYEAAAADLARYPAVDPDEYRRNLEAALGEGRDA